MIEREVDGVRWLQFELLADCPKLTHGVFLRGGGASNAPYESLNLGEQVGDDPLSVRKNREKVSKLLNLKEVASLKQCHTDRVIQLGDKDLNADGMITEQHGVGLMINHADCQAAIMYDPIKQVIGNVHAGWRGSVQNIYKQAIEKMRNQYGCNPADLLVGISPSLGPERAEFINYQQELPESFWDFQVKPCYFDFWKISRWQLEGCGVLPHHIEIAGICTFQNGDYFSYRREKKTGRHGTVIGKMPAAPESKYC